MTSVNAPTHDGLPVHCVEQSKNGEARPRASLHGLKMLNPAEGYTPRKLVAGKSAVRESREFM